MATTSNISSTWTPGQVGNCFDKCGPMGLSCAVFPEFRSTRLLLRRFLNDAYKMHSLFCPARVNALNGGIRKRDGEGGIRKRGW